MSGCFTETSKSFWRESWIVATLLQSSLRCPCSSPVLFQRQKKKTAKELAKGVAKNVKDCLEFRGGLPSATCLPRAKGRQQEGIS